MPCCQKQRHVWPTFVKHVLSTRHDKTGTHQTPSETVRLPALKHAAKSADTYWKYVGVEINNQLM